MYLQLFFEGVQAKVGAGVKESEVSYQMAFSKQELRRVVKEYPAREVKKGLENLYRKVEKHLCEEENLLQVILKYIYVIYVNISFSVLNYLLYIYLFRSFGVKCKVNSLHNIFT